MKENDYLFEMWQRIFSTLHDGHSEHQVMIIFSGAAEEAVKTGDLAGEPNGHKPETPAERIRHLQDEAQLLALGEISGLAKELFMVGGRAAAIATGGDAYPPGVRALAEQLCVELPMRAQALRALLERVRRNLGPAAS